MTGPFEIATVPLARQDEENAKAEFGGPPGDIEDARAAPPMSSGPDAIALLKHTCRMWTVGAVSKRSSIHSSWRPDLSLPCTLYGTSAAAYVIVGVMAIIQAIGCPEALSPEWPAPLFAIEGAWVVLQGILSYNSDVRFVAIESWAHCFDRCSAIVLMNVQFFKFGGWLPMSVQERVLLWAGVLAGILCKIIGNRAILANRVVVYKHAHTLWHYLPPLAIGAFNFSRWHSTCMASDPSG